MDREILRQLIHASGIFILILGIFLKPEALLLSMYNNGYLAEMIFVLDKYHNIPLLSTILSKCKRRDDERGFLYFFIGIIATLYLFSFNMAIAITGILMLLLGDSASTLIGRRFGRHKLPFNNLKSIEGSFAFFMVGFLSCLNIASTLFLR